MSEPASTSSSPKALRGRALRTTLRALARVVVEPGRATERVVVDDAPAAGGEPLPPRLTEPWPILPSASPEAAAGSASEEEPRALRPHEVAQWRASLGLL